MTDPISSRAFHDSEGVEDWRVLAAGAYARFRTRSFAKGVELLRAIGELADAANHHPDVDVRYASVFVRLFSHDVGALTERDLALARAISAAAGVLGIEADPRPVQDARLTIDALVGADVLPFWKAVLGYRQVGEEELLDPHARGPSVWFQRMDAPRSDRNRIHVDVWVPHDQAEARVAAALEAGGRLVTEEFAPAWWTLADPEGNEVDVATWMGRD